MPYNILQIKQNRRRKEIAMSKCEALDQYEAKQAEIKKLLKQIEAGLLKHDRNASGPNGHHWGHVSDLTSIADALKDLKDQLHGTGQYADVA